MNETLLLAPVLFLIVVALVFIRFFPLVVRFMSGESPALLPEEGSLLRILICRAGVAVSLPFDDGTDHIGPLSSVDIGVEGRCVFG